MPRRDGPVTRRRFDPKKAFGIGGKEDWDIIFSLPWPKKEWETLKAIEGSGNYKLDSALAEKYGFQNARRAAEAINLVFLVLNADYRFTHSPGGDYWRDMMLMKF
ncbi:MAG TPA: hypothetical protein VGE62_00445 [Candidatus Paceibacterota bacterium]